MFLCIRDNEFWFRFNQCFRPVSGNYGMVWYIPLSRTPDYSDATLLRLIHVTENFKDIFISPDLTRKQAEEDRKLRLKEIRIKGEVLDGVNYYIIIIIITDSSHAL